MTIFNFCLALFTLLIAEICFFKIASKFNIVDKPNHRSSHSQEIIRGGGIIFPLAVFYTYLVFDKQFPYFFIGVCLISIISFIDDLYTLNNKIRVLVQALTALLLCIELGAFEILYLGIILLIVLIIATINAINFMDGINGITGLYMLLFFLTSFWINSYLVLFTSQTLILMIIASLLVFLFFNFRIKAKCFAGDVGSISIAFISIFLTLQLVFFTNDAKYIFLLFVYGLDVSTTIIFRLIRKENIFLAHRTHFYQFLANDKKIPHLFISLLYVAIQLVINASIIWLSTYTFFLFVFVFSIGFIFLRFHLEGKSRLLNV